MEKRNRTALIVAIVTLVIALIVILIAIGFVIKNQTEEPERWVLHSYGNNVALYNGDQIIEVYGGIVLDTLPAEDKRLLDNGIAFESKEEAVNAIEDYDG